MQKNNPFLWFTDKVEEAMNFYISVFKNSEIVSITRYGEKFSGIKGKVLTAIFELDRQRFMALGGGLTFKFTKSDIAFCELRDTRRSR